VPGSTKILGPLGIVEQALSRKTEIRIVRICNIGYTSVKELHSARQLNTP